MKLKCFRIISVALLLGWMTMIFFLSNETAVDSSQTSGGFSEVLLSLFYPPFRGFSAEQKLELIESISGIVRKTAHFTIYGLLGVFAMLAVLSYRCISYAGRSILAWGICIIYAAFDEWHQTFIDGRSGELRDVIIDSCGALLFILIFRIVYKTVNRIRTRRRKYD